MGHAYHFTWVKRRHFDSVFPYPTKSLEQFYFKLNLFYVTKAGPTKIDCLMSTYLQSCDIVRVAHVSWQRAIPTGMKNSSFNITTSNSDTLSRYYWRSIIFHRLLGDLGAHRSEIFIVTHKFCDTFF